MTAPTAPTTPQNVTHGGGTEYVILTFNEDTDEWAEHGDHVVATSPAAAIRKHFGKAANIPAATFLAIPARSWKPVKVTPQTVTTLKLEEAK